MRCFIPVSYCHCKTIRSLSAVYSMEDFLSSHLGCHLLELGFETYLLWRIGSYCLTTCSDGKYNLDITSVQLLGHSQALPGLFCDYKHVRIAFPLLVSCTQI